MPDDSKRMRAVVHATAGELVLEDRPIPVVGAPDDVVIRVKAVGICGSDVHALHVPPTHPRRLGVIFGHEFCGEVVAVGSDVDSVGIGDLVAVDPNAPCGRCESCRRGSPNFCTTLTDNPHVDYRWPNTPGFFWDGGMAEFARVPASSVYRARADVPAHLLALAEPLGCVLNAVNKVGVHGGEPAAVIGAGPIGLLAIAVLRHFGAGRIVVIEPRASRALAARKVGADAVVNPGSVDDLAAAVRDAGGGAPSVIVEAVGTQLDAAIEIAADEARIALVGINSANRAAFAPAALTTKELTIHGAFLMRNTMRQSIQLIEGGQLPLGEIISHRLPLEEVHRAIDLAAGGGGLKVVLTP